MRELQQKQQQQQQEHKEEEEEFPGSVWAACRSTLCGHTGAVCSMVFHPRLPLLATGSADGAAKLWQFNSDYTSATCVCTLQGHSGAVLSVVFHARLPLLVAGNAGKCVKVWNLISTATAHLALMRFVSPRCTTTRRNTVQ